MKNVNFKDPSIHSFAFWGKEAVDELESVNVDEAVKDIQRLICAHDKAFSDELYHNIKENDAQFLKKHIDSLIAVAWKTILTNETLEEIKKDNPNIEVEVRAAMTEFENGHMEDLYIFEDFINCYAIPTAKQFYTEQHSYNSLLPLQEGIHCLVYYIKEWLGMEETEDLFKDEYARIEAIGEMYEKGDKDFWCFNSDSDYPDEDEGKYWPGDWVYALNYREWIGYR